MATSLSNTFWDQLIEIQNIQRQLFASQLMSSVESLNKALVSENIDAYSKIQKTYDTLAELYRTPGYLDTSFFTRQDVEDGSNGEAIEQKKVSSSSTSIEESITVSENTRADNINQANEQFSLYLESQTNSFISSLIWTDFEDGMENEITRQVEEYMERNRYVTFCWLNRIFNSNREKPAITSGLLRTLAMVVNPSDANIMLSMVAAGVASVHSEDQEAAIMVIEKWRTKECLEAMLNTTYGSDWVKEYAIQVITELKEELGV